MVSTLEVANNLGVASSVLGQGSADNLNRLGDPTARKLSASTTVGRLGGSGILRTSLSLTRGTDPLLEGALRKQVSRLEGHNTTTSFLRAMQSVIAGSNNSQESVLVTSVNEFFAQAKILESNGGIAMKQSFVDKGQTLAQRITDITSKGVSLQLEADNQMRESVAGVNSTIKSLFDLNHKLRITTHPIKLHDLRDNLVNDIAKYMDVKVTFEASGSVMLQSKSSGRVLVSGEHYAQFNYPGIQSESKIQNGIDFPPMTMTHYNVDGTKAREPIVFMGGSEDPTLEFSGGQWGGIVELRRETLPQMVSAAKVVGRNITKAVNAIHNSGTTFPPKSRFESSMDVYGSQTFDWKPFTIHAVSQNGDPLRGGAGLLNPITIDMSKVTPAQGGGAATLADMVKEINSALDTGPSRDRAAIGAITDGNNAQIAGEYLVNNIQLKSNGPVFGPNNSFTFELDLQGNSHFGSDIEVMGITTSDHPGGANAVNLANGQLPGSFRLDQGVNTATVQSITVDGINAPKQITVDVRVVGDNGQVQRGTITYIVNPNVEVNDRIAIDPATANQGGNFANPAAINGFTSVARAMLVDENGIEIDINANPTARGKLVIQTADDSYRLSVEGGLGQMFEFNNMFEFDEITGKMSVNSRVASDVNELAIGKATKGDGIDTVHTVGDVKASATLTFAGGAIANGDTVSVGGQVFTFAAVPVGPNQVLTGGGIAALRDAINNHPDVGGIVRATDVGNVLTIEAKNAGTGANAGVGVGIHVAFVLGGVRTIDLNGLGAQGNSAGLPPGNYGLINGTNKQETSKVYNYTIKPESGEIIEELSNLQFGLVSVTGDGLIPTTEVSLSNLATIFTGVLSDKLSAAEIESSVATSVLEQMHNTIQDRFGIKRDEEFIKAIEDGRLMQALARLLSMINNIQVKAEDIIFG